MQRWMTNPRFWGGLVGACLAAPGAARAQEPAPDLTEALRAVRLAAPAGRAAAVQRVVARKPAANEVVALLASGLHPIAPPKPGWSIHEAVDAQGVARPYHCYVPATLGTEPAPAPLLVHMHGGVSRPEFIDHRTFAQWRTMWVEQADRLGIVLALPLGKADCAWWTEAGVRHVQAVVRDVKRRLPVDDDRIFATGFSDGGSGAYFLALAHPDPWAAVLPLNGHPAVASQASGKQLYPSNTALTSLFIAHTADDSLYPVTTVMPHWQAFLEQGADCHVVLYPTGDHSPSYFGQQGAVFADYIAATTRGDVPPLVEWRTAHVETGAARWIAVTGIGATPADAAAPPAVNVRSRPGRVRLGIRINEAVAGNGVQVTWVGDGTTAAAIGMQVGDVIHGIDDRDVGGLRELRAALQRKHYGQAIRVRVTRAGAADIVELAGTIPPFRPEPVYPRTLPTAWIRASAIGDEVQVAARNVRRFRIEVRPGLLDLDTPVTVRVNGVVRFRGRVAVDLPGLLAGYAARADGKRLTLAVLDIDCTKPAAAPRKPGSTEDF